MSGLLFRFSLLSVLLCFTRPALVAQGTSAGQFLLREWQAHTSMINTRSSVADSSGRLWVASSGGVYGVDLNTNAYTQLRNTDGLLSLDIICLAFDVRHNDLYIGSFDGYIDIYHLSTHSWTHITDIAQASEQYPKRAVNHIQFRGDTAIIATDFGFSLFDTKRTVFIETVDRIGSFEQKTAVSKTIIVGDTLYIAGEAGVASAPLGLTTLRLPELWKRYAYRGADSLAGAIGIESNSRGLYAATPSAIFKLERDSFTVALRAPASYIPFKSIAAMGASLAYATTDRVGYLDSTLLTLKHSSSINSLSVQNTRSKKEIVICYTSSGAAIAADTSLRYLVPNSPYSNRVRDVTVDSRGYVWFATSNDLTEGQGVCMYDGLKWRNYNSAITSSFASDAVWRISSTSDSSVWGGTWGSGMLQFRFNGDSLSLVKYDTSNSSFCGIPNGLSFVLAASSASDSRATNWFLNPMSACNSFFLSRDKQGTWRRHVTPLSVPTMYRYMVIDASQTKWAAGADGLLYFNDSRTPDNNSDDVWGYMNVSNSKLLDNEVSAMVVDKNGQLWLGSSTKGVRVIAFPSAVLSKSVPNVQQLRLLKDQVVNCMAVDALNNKWIGTNTGVWILNEDGSDTIGYINRKNYPQLLADQIRSIAVNDADGTVYIGTLSGLNSVKTLSIKPSQSFSINCYPQPFSPKRDGRLVIEGLEAECELHIITPDGVLVREIETTSRRAVWDGRDEYGNIAKTGVYVVLAVSNSNASTAVQKVFLKDE